MQKYKDILVENGIKPTFQRITILEYLQKSMEHPTVDKIYADLFDKVPTLSKTTVYNTMEIFREKGLVNRLTFTESEMRYEHRGTLHHHFYCRVCGEIRDMNVGCEYQNSGMIEGHQIEEIHGAFRGVCRNCLNKS
jgi:Fe2+ or Zn2+ uptake regulation protein